MSQKRSWADTINFFPTKRQIQNIRNRQTGGSESDDDHESDNLSQNSNQANLDEVLSSGGSISEAEQLEDETQPLPGNTPWDKAKTVWHDDNLEIVVQRVGFRRQRNFLAEVI